MTVLEYDYNIIIEDFSQIKESKKRTFQHDGQSVNSLQPNHQTRANLEKW